MPKLSSKRSCFLLLGAVVGHRTLFATCLLWRVQLLLLGRTLLDEAPSWHLQE